MSLIEKANGILYTNTSRKEESPKLLLKTHFPDCKIVEQEEFVVI